MAGGNPIVLVIAGSDSSGGAGLQRDLRVLQEHRVEARSVITAVTAQSSARVRGIHHVPAEIIAAQIAEAEEDGTLAAVKIGMLGCAETVRAVAAGLAELRGDAPVVWDPVLVSSSGTPLLGRDAIGLALGLLGPMATLITPNLLEIGVLLEEERGGEEEEEALRLALLCGGSVLLKGGHAPGERAVDLLVHEDARVALDGPRLAGGIRGSGCALASAIAAQLARGVEMVEACRQAKAYVARLIAAAYSCE